MLISFTSAKEVNVLAFVCFVCLCLQDHSKKLRSLLEYLAGWDMCLATADKTI